MERTFLPREPRRPATSSSIPVRDPSRVPSRPEIVQAVMSELGSSVARAARLGHSIARIAVEPRAARLTDTAIQRKIPPTKVGWTTEKKKDTANSVEFTYPVKMEAVVSQDAGGYKGSAPDGKSAWWPYFQQRHSVLTNGKKIYWVQGHLLNDNLHGPGTSENLVPISNTSNTNMETKGERTAKDLVKKGGVIHYTVTANWDQTPDTTFKNFGGYDAKAGTGLLPGECTAPTSLSWQVKTMKEQTTDNWVDDQEVQSPEPQWYNTFPQ